MRRRWIADEFDAQRAALTGAHAAHLARVLRARVGQEFDIAAGERVRRGRVTRVTDERVEFALGEDVPAPRLAPVTVVLAVIKFDRFEWAVEKLTELGVARIVPLVAARTDAHLAAAAGKRVERWRRVAREAAEQSRRTAAPEIAAPIKLQAALAPGGETRVVLAESEHDAALADVLQAHRDAASWTLAIGPEGGWTHDEVARFAAAGWLAASLGPTILRTETAAVAALAVLQALTRA